EGAGDRHGVHPCRSARCAGECGKPLGATPCARPPDRRDTGPVGVAAVEVAGLRVARGGRVVLDGLDLTVRRGAVTGLLGPSGSGKTTLMRAILGVQVVTSGRVTVLGEAAGSPSLRSRVAYVTQAPSVYDDLTVEENLRYFARVLGLRGSKRTG